MQVLAVHGRTLLAHLRVQDHAHGCRVGTHRERDADVADDRADDVTLPAPLGVAVARAAPQADAGGINGFLSQRTKSFSLKRQVAVAHLAAREKLLQPVVNRAREDHAAQNLAALVAGQRGGNIFAREEPVARVGQRLAGRIEASGGGYARRRVGQPRNRQRADAAIELAPEGAPLSAPPPRMPPAPAQRQTGTAPARTTRDVPQRPRPMEKVTVSPSTPSYPTQLFQPHAKAGFKLGPEVDFGT